MVEGLRPVSSARVYEAGQAAVPHGALPRAPRAARALRVVLAPRNGEMLVDIRIWNETADGAWVPTSEGVRFNTGLARAVADELLRAAVEADRLAGGRIPGN